MVQMTLHHQTLKKKDAVCEWYQSKLREVQIPIYSSYDIRDSGYKITNVDANIYPAGFNNICPTDKENASELFAKYLNKHYCQSTKKILLVTEEHTQNPFYWENIVTIKGLLEQAGKEVQVGFPRALEAPLVVESATGKKVEIQSADMASAFVKSYKPDLVISNNDFSQAYESWAETFDLPINPPRELGWYQRKKSRYFKFYNQLVQEFSKIAQVDPFLLSIETEEFLDFDIQSEASRHALADRVDIMISNLRATYRSRGLQQEPFVFVKNNAGTYGLAVIKVNSGAEVKEWSYKSRKKMKAAKGGREVEEVIIQEGIPSIVSSEGASAEPVIYMVGSELAGGFLRTHGEKSSTESLNSPGAVYKRLCVSDLLIKAEGCPMENTYGWTAKLGLLAIGYEAEEMKTTYRNYIR
jgi:glutamate--cysteine ligase